MNKNIIAILVGLLIISCNQKLRVLSDGSTKVTDDIKRYKNVSKFNRKILIQVDTSVIYKEVAFIQDLDSSNFGLNKSKKYRVYYLPDRNYIGYYRFYSNGFVNSFYKSPDKEIDLKNFNPDSTGYRGVFYESKDGSICIDLFQPVTGYGRYGINKEYITFSGDSMFVKRENNTVSSTVYIKTKMNGDLVNVSKWK